LSKAKQLIAFALLRLCMLAEASVIRCFLRQHDK
jgi:hypothetical protein